METRGCTQWRSRERIIFIGEKARANRKHNIRSPFSYFLFPASLQSENFPVSLSKWSMIPQLIVGNQSSDPLTVTALLSWVPDNMFGYTYFDNTFCNEYCNQMNCNEHLYNRPWWNKYINRIIHQHYEYQSGGFMILFMVLFRCVKKLKEKIRKKEK